MLDIHLCTFMFKVVSLLLQANADSNMMPVVSLVKGCVVSIEGAKKPWIIKQKDVKTVDGQLFVKLCSKNSSLSSMFGNRGGYLCLGRSNGYHELVQMRNNQAFAAVDACRLFDVSPTKKKPKTKKGETKRAVDRAPIDVVLHMSNFDYIVTLLRPSTPSDAIFVVFEENSIARIIKWIQDKGFKDANPKRTQRSSELPKGVYAHPKGFLVGYTDSDGNKRRKFKPELSQALSFLANPTKDESGDEHNDADDDDSHDDDKENHANAADAAGSDDHVGEVDI